MSVFQLHPPQQATLPLSFGIERALLDQLQGQEQITESSLVSAIAAAYGLVYPLESVERHMQALITSVLDRIESLQAKEQDKPPRTPTFGKSLGTNYSDWLNNLDTTGVCLYLSDYDIEKARHLYWHTDLQVVQEAVKQKGQQDSLLALVQMEACLYGSGGKYSDDDGGGGNHYDLSSGEGLAALKSMGF